MVQKWDAVLVSDNPLYRIPIRGQSQAGEIDRMGKISNTDTALSAGELPGEVMARFFQAADLAE